MIQSTLPRISKAEKLKSISKELMSDLIDNFLKCMSLPLVDIKDKPISDPLIRDTFDFTNHESLPQSLGILQILLRNN